MTEKYKPCPDNADRMYAVGPDGKSITFLPCGITSHHPKDVEHRYCGLCHRFVEQK